MVPTLTFDLLIKLLLASARADCQRKQNDIQDLKVQVYCYHIVKYITAVKDLVR